MKRLPLLPDFPRPLLFAHRGASSLAPENTMASFRLARELGCPGLELDVHLCATGELVVVHDDSLKRTCGLDRPVGEISLAELRGLSAGSWFSPSFCAERVPLLDEVLEECSPVLYIDIELKTRLSRSDPLPPALAACLLRHSARNIVVSSFNPLALAAFKRLAPGYPVGPIWCADRELPWYLRQGQGRWLCPADFLKPVHSGLGPLSLRLLAGFRDTPIVPWTVDETERAQELLGWGCAGIITNRPRELSSVIASFRR